VGFEPPPDRAPRRPDVPSPATRTLLLACCWLSAACAAGGPDRPDPDALVQSPVERLWQVGGVEDTTLVFETLTRNDVVADAHDRLFVIDRTGGRIAVLDSTGAVVDTWGAPGPGPGEFLFPLTLAVAPDGALHVFDAEKSRLVVFTPEGRFREEDVAATGRPFRFRFRADSTIVGTTPPRTGGGVRLLTDSAGAWQTLDSVPSGTTGMIESVCSVIGYTVEPVFHPVLAWDARGDTIVSATGEFAITLRTPRWPPRIISRETTRRPTDRALAARELGPGRSIQFRGRRPCTIPTEMLLEVAHVAPRMPAYTDLTLGTQGHLWATRDVLSDEPTVADLFHLDSGFVRTVTLGSARPVLFLRSGIMISIEHDADDVPRIVAYRVPPSVFAPR
jgi:hypothetical protein